MSSLLKIQDVYSSIRLPREFLICDFCFWAASAISARRHDVVKCPQCGAAISRIPLSDNERFNFSYDKKRGVELDFAATR
ncbi:MAG TPA: hypothetical protein VHK86_02775 [Nitrososphaera sp.]|nr:hypothetical protein [Nitrososphaera sp.]